MTIIIPVWLLWVLGFLSVYFTLAACALTSKGDQLYALDEAFSLLKCVEAAIKNKDLQDAEYIRSTLELQRRYKQAVFETSSWAFWIFPITLIDFYWLGVRPGMSQYTQIGFLAILFWPKTLIEFNAHILDNVQRLNTWEQKILLKLKEAGVSID